MVRTNLMWSLAVLALAGAAVPGCVGVDRRPPCDDVRPACLEIPACSRHRVWVFLLSGIDPLCCMDGLRGCLIDHGFIKIHSGHKHHVKHFVKEMEKILHCDEEPRFVIVSQGSAATAARELARSAPVPIDLFVLLDETGVGPAPAKRVLYIHPGKKATDPHVAEESYDISDAGPLGTVNHPETAKLLAKELCALAASIPVVEVGPKCELADCPPCQPGWGFLRPDGHDSGCIHRKPLDLAVGAGEERRQP